MAALWISVISVATFFATIALIVLGQEIHPLLSVVLFIVISFGAFKLFQAKITRL
ncbi:MAG: hypothetical protein HQ472_01860 [Ignavibacteria bacterium]|nr:hypothetical protein [Ignavibacteria bacterium]